MAPEHPQLPLRQSDLLHLPVHQVVVIVVQQEPLRVDIICDCIKQ